MDNLSLCLNYLEQGKCILFLGPRFAIDATGNKLHEDLKNHLLKTEFKEELDFTFDNLFIFKEAKPNSISKMRLNIELKNYYANKEPHEVYTKIPFLPFQAIISCSPDLYLKEAFKEAAIPAYFQYYSHRGVVTSERRGDGPIVYNVFGNIEVENSLITTYENFFRFVISIISDEQKIPIDLQNAIAKASVMVFCGFDLTKWYIPLLIHKLNSYRNKEEIDLSAALINKDNFTDANTNRLYPLELLVMDEDTVPMIEKLYDALQRKDLLRKPQPQKDEEDVKKIQTFIQTNEMDQAIDALLSSYGMRRLSQSSVILLKGRYIGLQEKKNAGVISFENEQVEMNQIRESLMKLVDKLESP